MPGVIGIRKAVGPPNPFDEEDLGVSAPEMAGVLDGLKRDQLRAPPERPPEVPQSARSLADTRYLPTASLGEHVGRWYESTGGIDRAIQSAQEAQDRRSTRAISENLFPRYNVLERVRSQHPVSMQPGKFIDGRTGNFTPDFSGPGQVWVKPDGPHSQATLEHELTHAALLPGVSSTLRLMDMTGLGRSSESWPSPRDEYDQYVTRPEEVDVRLAEIKRRYAHHTGRLVDTPDEARKAWQWWSRNQNRLRYDDSHERPEDSPTLDDGTFDLYDSQPNDVREQFFHRMPELVRAEDQIRKYRNA